MRLLVPCILDGYDHSAYWMRSVGGFGCLQIGVVDRGSCTVQIAGHDYELHEGSVVLVDTSNDLMTKQRSRGSRYSGLLFDWEQRRLEATDAANPHRGWQPVPGQADQPPWLALLGGAIGPIAPAGLARAITAKLALATRRWWQGPQERMRANGILHEILLEIMQWRDPVRDAPANAAQGHVDQRVHAWVRQHVHERPTVEDCARALGLTRSHLSRSYRHNRESGPGEMIRHMILEQIELEIRLGDSIEDIATRFSWTSARQLTQYVSRATGIPWRQWLGQVQKS